MQGLHIPFALAKWHKARVQGGESWEWFAEMCAGGREDKNKTDSLLK